MDNLLDFAIHLPYLTIALIWLAILILSVLLDGLFDFLDFGDGILSVTTFSAFITIFGFVGVICTNLTLTAGITLLIATLSGLTVAIITTLTMRMMKKMTTPDTLNSTTVIGRTGTVTLPLNPPNNLGEISVPYQGESQYYTAIADTPIPLGTEVTVTQVLSPTNVKIQIKEKP